MKSILGLVFFWAVAVAAQASPISGGNPVVSRPSLDGFSNFSILDRNHPIDGNGLITQWQIFAGNTNPVELLIYRPTGVNAYALIGNSTLQAPTANMVQTKPSGVTSIEKSPERPCAYE